MEENSYISEEQLVKLKEWTKSEEGKKRLVKFVMMHMIMPNI